MTTPVLTGQDIGRAHLATRALLERRLDGLPFPAWVALNQAGSAPSPLGRAAWVAGVMHGLKVDRGTALGVIGSLAGLGLVTADGAAELTPSGRVVFERVTEAVRRTVETLYGDIPEADQLVARRVLDLVRARADRELAAAPADA